MCQKSIKNFMAFQIRLPVFGSIFHPLILYAFAISFFFLNNGTIFLFFKAYNMYAI